MQALKIALLVLAIIYGLVYIILAICGKKPFKTIIITALCGILSLAAVNLTSRFTGVHIPLNAYTVATSAAGGFPAATALLLLRMLFGL